MLTADPKERYSATQVLSHEWFKRDFSANKTLLQPVRESFIHRKSVRIGGKLSISEMIKVENLD